MSFFYSVLAVIISLLLPLLNLLTPAAKVEGVYSETAEVTKMARKYVEFNYSENDLVLSPSGDDFAEGTPASPLRSPEEAVARIKQLREKGCSDAVTVWLREGEYDLLDTVTLDETVGAVSFCAYNGEKVTVTCIDRLKDFTTEMVNGKTVWCKDVPYASLNSLFRNGVELKPARYPESGYLTVKAPDESDALFNAENTPWSLTRGYRSFFTNKDIGLDNIYNVEGVRIKLLHYWCCENTFLTAFDSASGRFTMKQPASMEIRENDRYFLENIREGLNSPGEWYFDTAKGKVYYVPQAGDDINSLELCAPKTQTLFRIENTGSVSFNNIGFSMTDWEPSVPDTEYGNIDESGLVFPQGNLECVGAFEIRNADNIVFQNCDFENLGCTGIRFKKLVKNCSVTGCRFENIGSNVIFVDGYNAVEDERITENVRICDNRISAYGRHFPSGIAVILTHARNCEISHNEISDGYYTAISVGWVWGYAYSVTDNNKITDNRIYDIGQGWLSDMGGIYTLGKQPSTVISGNVINNVAADAGEGGYGGWGIYLDEGSSRITVEKNLVYDCGSQGFHQHYGEDNLIRNNIFALNRNGQVRNTRTEDHNELFLKNNIILSDNNGVYTNIDGLKFVDSDNLYWDLTNGKRVYATTGEDNKIKNRLFDAAMKNIGYFDNAHYADPLFKDAKNFDFTLADNSPAIKEIGFETWNYAEAGTISEF